MTTIHRTAVQLVLFAILMTWPLLPYMATVIFTDNVLAAASAGASALGLY